MVSQNISRSADTIGLVVSLSVATLFVAARTSARWYKLRHVPFQPEDLFMYLALVSFAITCALYLATIPTFFYVTALQADTTGTMVPSPSLATDLVVMLKEFFTVQFFFWLTLWAVKWSLMSMFRRLTSGLPFYNRVWWGVLVFSILAFIASCISNFFSCSSMHAWFTAGLCETERDSRAKTISLWLSLGADLSTDLLIMAVPIRVLWNLRISLLEKISIGVIFGVGILTMVTAIIRSVSLNMSSASGQVSTTWLMLWAGIEGAVAIMVGCLPSFAVFIRGRVTTSRANYKSNSNKNSLPNSQGRSHQRIGSTPRHEDSLWQLNDTASSKSLVQDGSHEWSVQGKNSRERQDGKMGHELDTIHV